MDLHGRVGFGIPFADLDALTADVWEMFEK